MHRIIRFKRYLTAETVPDDGVYLFSERPGQTRLAGALIERLTPLLSGKKSRSEVVDALAEEFGADRVNNVLDRLITAGQVVEVAADVDPSAGGYWEISNVDGDAAVRAVAGGTVDVVCLSDHKAAEFIDAASSLGLTVNRGDAALPADITVVLTDDYLNPELADFNRKQLANEKPWLLAKTAGSVLWVGPVFEPGSSACWQCLASRLSSNQMLMSYLAQRTDQTRVPMTSVADLPLTRRLGADLVALHAAKWIASAFGHSAPVLGGQQVMSAEPNEVFTLDTVTLQAEHHPLQRRPQCPACGDAGLQDRLQRLPITLTSRPKTASTDGGHRARSAEALLTEYEPLVSPVTGVVKQLIRQPDAPEGLYTYFAGQNFAVPMRGIVDLRAGLRAAACGKGISEIQAKASAVAEAIERYSGLFRGDEARIPATMADLGDAAIPPNDLALYSERQFEERARWNAKGSHFQRVTDPFDPEQVVDWTPVWSLSRRRTRYLPTASLFFGYPVMPGNVYAGADSNGNAAGTCLEDAILQGFFELVERDSVAMWWYNMVRRPAIDLGSFDEPYFLRWKERYRAVNREVWCLDVTSDLGIPAVVAVSRRIDKPVEDILLAFGAHFDIRVAISRAMTEMNQFLPSVVRVTEENDNYAYPDPDQQRWWRTATVANQPYLLPADTAPRTAADYTDRSTTDLAEDVRIAEQIVSDVGLEMLVLDQTRPDIRLPVVKVIVPGMRHFWTRFAPGRLYDIPLKHGWLEQAKLESELNPIGMFL